MQVPAGKIFYGITATDISYPALAKRLGGNLPRTETFDRCGVVQNALFHRLPWGTEWQVNESLRRRIAFGQLNLMEVHKAPFTGLDVIFCQNVLIYFRRFKKRDIVNELANRLTPGEFLVLGPGRLLTGAIPALNV